MSVDRITRETLDTLEKLCVDKHISVHKGCRLAGINPNSFYRWRSGKTSPTLRSLQDFHDAVMAYEISQ